ncbi:MAG TPA: queuosine precursor transporter [Thermoflexales bacterium]|nr:queuosine precursor transporter [Thermoflexales bacterium]
MGRFKYLDIILGLFVSVLLISNIASSAKIIELGQLGPLTLTFDAGTLVFPLSYIFSDVLTEVYGYRNARRVIWIGFFSLLLTSLVLVWVGRLPGEAFWLSTTASGEAAAADFGQQAYDKIFGLTVRIVLGSLAAYWCGSFLNDFLLARLKVRTAGRYLWVRTIGSTLVGEGVDTLIFAVIAFAGVLPTETLVTLIVSNYVFKVGVEVVFTPLTYAIVNRLKQAEGVDVFDRDTDFNPFILSTPQGQGK